MGIDNPVGGNAKDPYEPYRRHKEALEHHEREMQNEKKSKQDPAFIGKFAELTEKTLDYVVEMSEKRGSKGLAGQTGEDLAELKLFFETLKKEDRSQDAPFLHRLSKLWHQILEDDFYFNRNSSLSKPFRDLFMDLQNYPLGSEHSFAYYLTEAANQKWLPFPYMELIKKIHEDHHRDSATSALNRWIEKIDKLMTLLVSLNQKR